MRCLKIQKPEYLENRTWFFYEIKKFLICVSDNRFWEVILNWLELNKLKLNSIKLSKTSFGWSVNLILVHTRVVKKLSTIIVLSAKSYHSKITIESS